MSKIEISGWPHFSQEEAEKVAEVLLSNKINYWTGQEGREFEKEFAAFSDSQYAIATANGTLALDLALNALSIGSRNGGSKQDEVIVTSRTFIASISCIVLAGAVPVFADVDSESQNITHQTINTAYTANTKAIIAVHLAGWPCEMDAIMDLAKQNGLMVIEDCAQAHGAKYKGKSVGSLGHIGCWSFCQDKIMTTGGEGGMVTTNDQALWKKMWAFKDHGKSYDAVYKTEHPPGFRWLHESFGTNSRLTEMQSAIGRIQLKRMSDWTQKRQHNSELIEKACIDIACIRTPQVPSYLEHARYKHYLFLNLDKLKTGWNRDKIIEEINKNGVPCMQGSCSEVYLEKAFDNTDFRPTKRLDVAKRLGESSLMFLVHPSLSLQEMEYTVSIVKSVLSKASV